MAPAVLYFRDPCIFSVTWLYNHAIAPYFHFLKRFTFHRAILFPLQWRVSILYVFPKVKYTTREVRVLKSKIEAIRSTRSLSYFLPITAYVARVLLRPSPISTLNSQNLTFLFSCELRPKDVE